MTFDDVKGLIGLSLRDPANGARRLLSLNVPVAARWMGLCLAVSVSSILAALSGALVSVPDDLPAAEGAAIGMVAAQPLLVAGLQLAAILLAAGLMAGVGRMFGGKGRFEDALLLTVWIEVVMLVVQVVQTLALLIVPVLSGYFGIIAIALFLWLTVQFTKVLHGFDSSIKVTLALFGTALVAGFVLSFIAAAFGLIPGGMQ